MALDILGIINCVHLIPHTAMSTQVTEEEVVGTIQRLNEDPRVNAILLQLPLDSTNQIDADRCTNTIAVNKVLLIVHTV